MKQLSEMKWNEFETMSESDAVGLADEVCSVKQHQVYFIEAGGYFGLIALVFKNGHNIKYAADSELHHRGYSKEKTKNIILKGMKKKLFTDQELEDGSAVVDYETYQAASYYVRNYYILRFNYESAFYIPNGHTAAENKAREDSLKGLVYNPYSFCYMNASDAAVSSATQKGMLEAIESAWDEIQKSNTAALKKAFLREMYNHEYSINLDPDRETLAAFGLPWNFKSDNVDDMLSYLKYNDDQKRAYYEAARECLKNSNY